MATNSVRQVRQRFAARLEAYAELHESTVLYEQFGEDANTVQHLAFAVGVPTSVDTHEYRSNPVSGALVDTNVGIKFAIGIRPLDRIPSLDEALDIEDLVIRHLLARPEDVPPTWPVDLTIQWGGAERAPLGDFIVVSLELRVRHHLALS